MPGGRFFAGVLGFRWLFGNFLHREISGRYVGTISGPLWVLLHPLALLAIYGFVFAVVFRVNIPELKGRDFIEFVALGLWPWLAFQEGIQRATLSVQAAAGLIKKVAFPHELLVYAAIASTYFIHLAGFALVLVVMKLLGKDLHFSALPAAAAFLLFQALFASGLAMLFAALQVFARDVEQILTPLMMIWFYATPVLYPASLVPPQMQSIMALNPMSAYIGGVRDALLYGASGLSLYNAIMAAVGVAVFFAGRAIFRRLSPHFEDFL